MKKVPSTKVYTMFVLVLVVFALLDGTAGNELTNTTGLNTTNLPYSNAQNSTVSILNELNETSVLSTTHTEKTTYFDFIDTSIGSRYSSSIEKQKFPQTSPINSHFNTLPGGNELKNVGEYSSTDSSQDTIITDTSVTPSDSSSKITWSPGISLSILAKEGHSTTSALPSHKSEAEVYHHRTTPNIYNSLNHNENELDAEVRDGELYSTMDTTIKNPTSPTIKVSESVSIADPGADDSFPVEGTTSRVKDETTFSPISLDSESEHPKTTVKVNTPEPSSITDELSELSSSSMPPKTSTLASEENFNTMSEIEKDSSSGQITSDLDRTTISHETKISESPFRHTRNTKSMADFATTEFSDYFVFNSEEQMSTTQESVTPDNDTNSTTFNPIFPITSLSSELETTSLPENLTENGSTMLSLSTSHAMNENISIQDSETEFPTPLHSITTAKTQEETSSEIQTDLSASEPSQIDTEMKPIVSNTENNHDVENSFVTSTMSNMGEPTQTFTSEITSPTTHNQSSSDHFMNTPNVTSTSVLNITAMQEIHDTTSDNLLKITVPFDEKTTVTKDVSYISDIPAELTTIESDVTAVQGNQETTSGRLPRMDDLFMDTTHSSEEQPSTVLSTHIFDDENIMVTSNVSHIPIIPDEFSTLKSVDSEPEGKEILTSLTSNTEITDDPINQNSSLTSLSTDVTTHQKLDDTTVKDIGQLTTTSPVDPSIISSIKPTTFNPITSVTHDQVSSTTPETPISRSEFQSTFFDSGELTPISSIDTASDVYTSTSFVEDPLISNPTSEHTDIISDLSSVASTSFFNQASSSSSTSDEESTTFTHLPLTEVNTEDPLTTTSRDFEDISSLEVTTLSSTSSKTTASIHVFPSMLSTSEPSDSTGEIFQTTGMESNGGTSSSSSTKSSFDYTSVPPSNPATETYREGKRIPFSTESSRKSPVESSNNVIFISSTQMMELETTTISIMEEFFNQLYYEDLTSRDQDNVITAVVQLPSQDMDNLDIDSKVSSVHNWLTDVLMKEFQNWTKDPFDETESNSSDVPFGKISIFYLSPTPNIQSSNITMSFIVHNQWRNDTLPVDFVLSILKFYSEDFKQSMNATLVDFYHGLPVEEMDLIPLIMEKYGAVVFIIGVVAIGSVLFICVLVIYKKRHRRSIHYLSTGKLQHNLPESVGIDLTPDVVILQDEKKILNGNNKICDDEGWLVPIHEVPLAEDSNMPKVQDTKL